MTSILVHYKAFRSDIVFAFTGEGFLAEGVSLGDLTETDLLEFVFRQCNVVHGDEWISVDPVARSLRLRSMSVGDVVMVVRAGKVTRYLCAGCGWEKIEDER